MNLELPVLAESERVSWPPLLNSLAIFWEFGRIKDALVLSYDGGMNVEELKEKLRKQHKLS